jgi:hypothetical protein
MTSTGPARGVRIAISANRQGITFNGEAVKEAA